MSIETELAMRETFMNEMSDALLSIHADIEISGTLTKHSLPSEKIEAICDKLDALAERARGIMETAKAEMLVTISTIFYLLDTGMMETPEKFNQEAAHAFQLVEVALLAMDGSVNKNQGEILKRLQRRRENRGM